jgi:hypothetical protein
MVAGVLASLAELELGRERRTAAREVRRARGQHHPGYGGSTTVPVTVAVSPKDLPTVTIPIGNLGNRPFGIAVSPDGRWVYTANYDDRTVSVVDTPDR